MDQTERNDEMNLKALAPLGLYVAEQYGEKALADVMRACNGHPSQLDGSSHWESLEFFEKVLEESRKLMSSDEEFLTASAYKMAEQTGSPMRLLLGLLSPNVAYTAGCKKSHLIQRIGEFAVIESGPGRVTMRFTSTVEESTPLTTLSRVASLRSVPTLWGLPPAQVKRTKCKLRGDPYFEYAIRFFVAPRWSFWLLGTFLGLLAGYVGSLAFALTWPLIVMFVGIGFAGGYGYDVGRTNATNAQTIAALEREFDSLTNEEAENRRVLGEYQERQRSWTRMLEEEVAERTGTLTGLLDQIRQLQQHRVVEIRGVSHDLKNPLTAIMSSAELLRRKHGRDNESRECAADILSAVRTMEKMLGGLIENTSGNPALVPNSPTRVDVTEITDALRRRLKALVYAKEVRASVFRTREAPRSLTIDRLIFERIVDNLISNAAKYTEQGSIIVEVDGRPGMLAVKVSDTGRGIPSEDLDKIFVPEAPLSNPRAAKSYGLGLSIVVKLLGQIGGKLEVMSNEGIGTTFWVFFPVEPVGVVAVSEAPPSDGEVRDKVVRIRRLEGLAGGAA